ncbi:MAG TPA: hypothetical protein DDY82_00885 [Clostridiales bacterium]|nr:hypothetical protein [Clostridiales bacterium]HBJ97618.1 hypothetical protein [Clostridiales bacterium]
MKKSELNKINTMITVDRLGISENFKDALLGDLLNVFNDYMIVNSKPEINVQSVDKGFSLIITLKAESFKGFKAL